MAANSFAAELMAVILPVKLERRQPELLPVQPNVKLTSVQQRAAAGPE